MKVIYYSHPYFADSDFPLIKALINSGIDVYYFILIRPSAQHATILDIKSLKKEWCIYPAEELSELQKFNTFINLKKTYIVNIPNQNIFRYEFFRLMISLKKMMKNINADIFHTTIEANPYYWMFNNICKAKHILTVHDPILHSSSKKNCLRKFIRKNSIQSANHIFILNNRLTSDFVKYYDLKMERVDHSRLGINECAKLFLPSDSKRLKQTNQYILFFGRISAYKGVDLLIEAMDIVHKIVPTLQLRIVGKSDKSISLSNFKRDYIIIRDEYLSNDELALEIDNSSFVVCPYKDATQSGVVCTAYAFGKPVIATDVGGMREYIANEVSGILVEPNSPQKLAEAICRVFSNKNLLNTMSENIRCINETNSLSWENIAKKYINAYKILSNKTN